MHPVPPCPPTACRVLSTCTAAIAPPSTRVRRFIVSSAYDAPMLLAGGDHLDTTGHSLADAAAGQVPGPIVRATRSRWTLWHHTLGLCRTLTAGGVLWLQVWHAPLAVTRVSAGHRARPWRCRQLHMPVRTAQGQPRCVACCLQVLGPLARRVQLTTCLPRCPSCPHFRLVDALRARALRVEASGAAAT